jgi:hypothetical protein
MNLVRLGGDWARGFLDFPARFKPKAASSPAFRLEGERPARLLHWIAPIKRGGSEFRSGPPRLVLGIAEAKGMRVFLDFSARGVSPWPPFAKAMIVRRGEVFVDVCRAPLFRGAWSKRRGAWHHLEPRRDNFGRRLRPPGKVICHRFPGERSV